MIKIFSALLITFLILAIGCGRENKNNGESSLNKPVKETAKLDYFIFVGMEKGNAGLFKYDINKEQSYLLWSEKKEKVVDLSFSLDRKTSFFLTAGNYGKKGAFPFIDRVKLYLLSKDSVVTFIKEIGSGMQVFTSWETGNAFKVILNSIDRTVASYIEQHTQIFNEFGKQLVDETKTYNLTADGYPKPLERSINNESTDGNFSIFSSQDSVFIIYPYKQKELISITKQKINQVEWSNDGKFVFISTFDISSDNKTLYDKNPNTSKLLIFSLDQKKILKQWEGVGIKNFFVQNNFLIFDGGFKNNFTIHIYNFKEMKPADEIKIEGGCGLRNIPEIPD